MDDDAGPHDTRNGFANDGDAKGPRTTRWTVTDTAVAAGAVFILDCGDALSVSCRAARLEAFAPAGTDLETLGLDFSIAKFAAKPSFPPLGAMKASENRTTSPDVAGDDAMTPIANDPPPAKDVTGSSNEANDDEDDDDADDDDNDDATDRPSTDRFGVGSFFDPTRLSVLDLRARPELARALDAAAISVTRVRCAFESAHRGGATLHVGPPRDEGAATGGPPFVSGFRVTPPADRAGGLHRRDWIIRVTASFTDGGRNGDALGQANGHAHGFLGFLRDRQSGDGGSVAAAPDSRLPARDGPPVPEAARDFLAETRATTGGGDAASSSDARDPTGDGCRPTSRAAFRVGDFLVPHTRGGAPLQFEFREDVAGFERLVFESLSVDAGGGGGGTDGRGDDPNEDDPPAPSLVGRVRCYRLG